MTLNEKLKKKSYMFRWKFRLNLTAVNQKKLIRLSEQQNHRCYCGSVTLNLMDSNYKPDHKLCATIEHLEPLSSGGTYNFSNLVMACRNCNINRSNVVTAEQFFEIRKYDFWKSILRAQAKGQEYGPFTSSKFRNFLRNVDFRSQRLK